MAGIRSMNRADDFLFRGFINLGDEIVLRFFGNVESVDMLHGADNYVASVTSSTDRDIQRRVHGNELLKIRVSVTISYYVRVQCSKYTEKMRLNSCLLLVCTRLFLM